MIVFVFSTQNKKWQEVSELFPHDIAILLDDKNKEAYFWAGKRAEKGEIDVAFKKAIKMIEKYRSYELIALGKSTIPLKIQTEIDSLMLASTVREKELIPRSQIMQYVMYLGFLGVILSAVMVINNIRILSWSEPGYFKMELDELNNLFRVTEIICIIAIGVFLFQLLMSFLARQIFLNATAFTNIIIHVGVFFYLAQKYSKIFDHELDSNPDTFLLLTRSSVINEIFWVILAFGASLLCVFIQFMSLRNGTKLEPKNVADGDQRLDSRPTILRDKEYKFEKLETTPFK